MMIRYYTRLVLGAAVVVYAGCAAPADRTELVQQVSAAATSDCTTATDTCDVSADDGSTPVAFAIASFDASTLVMTGTNGLGDSLDSAFTSATTLRPSDLSRYLPTDPCHDAAVAYNDALTTTSGDSSIYTSINGLVGCNARVWIDQQTLTIRAFRPVP